jgi:hypothetical protein
VAFMAIAVLRPLRRRVMAVAEPGMSAAAT